MVSSLSNFITSTRANDINAELSNQTQRLSSLEQELERLNQQLRQNQRYTAALEVDFEHLLSQLQHIQCNKKAC
jgi:chromosome segregation ATPase